MSGLDRLGDRITPAINIDWIVESACFDLEIDAFFVPAGAVIDDAVLEVCRSCPVRVDCVRHAYTGGHRNGYFGGLSPGQRRRLTLDEAIALVRDTPAPTV